MNTLFNLLLPILEGFAQGDGQYYAMGMACIGAGLAVLIPSWMEVVWKKDKNKFIKFSKNVMLNFG